MEGDKYLGFSGRFFDPRYCHQITDLSEDSEDSRAVVVYFPSDSCKLNWYQAVGFMKWLAVVEPSHIRQQQ